MNTELHTEETIHEFELPHACIGCGGPVDARFTPGGGRGVCLACHILTPMAVIRTAEGVKIVQAPVGAA